jgi:hypothetical protein
VKNVVRATSKQWSSLEGEKLKSSLDGMSSFELVSVKVSAFAVGTRVDRRPCCTCVIWPYIVGVALLGQ